MTLLRLLSLRTGCQILVEGTRNSVVCTPSIDLFRIVGYDGVTPPSVYRSDAGLSLMVNLDNVLLTPPPKVYLPELLTVLLLLLVVVLLLVVL